MEYHITLKCLAAAALHSTVDRACAASLHLTSIYMQIQQIEGSESVSGLQSTRTCQLSKGFNGLCLSSSCFDPEMRGKRFYAMRCQAIVHKAHFWRLSRRKLCDVPTLRRQATKLPEESLHCHHEHTEQTRHDWESKSKLLMSLMSFCL